MALCEKPASNRTFRI